MCGWDEKDIVLGKSWFVIESQPRLNGSHGDLWNWDDHSDKLLGNLLGNLLLHFDSFENRFWACVCIVLQSKFTGK